MNDAYSRFERWDAQQERSAAEWYADLWMWMREQSDLAPATVSADAANATLTEMARKLLKAAA